MRVLADPDVPPCAGAYRPIEVIAPEGSLLNAQPPRAVVAGNVETSSRVADLVLEAFGRALGQGTMNNLTLGNDDFTYYETIGGGQGACADADGPSARARRDEQHAQHADRGAGARVPAARRRVRGPARLGRRRATTAAATASSASSRRSRDDDLLADHRAPPPPLRAAPPAARTARAAATVNGEERAAQGRGYAERGRPAANRDPGRRRTWREPERWRSSAWGSWVAPMAANLAPGRVRADRLEPDP